MQIQTNIPLPEDHRGGYYRYKWDEMGIGASFFVPEITIQSLSSAANRAASRLDMKFTCRSVTEDGVEGVRVWRTE